MEKIKRNERIGVIIKTLVDAPGRIFTLSHFSDMFDAAKSTISEDILIIKNIFTEFDMGEVETVTGAAGGVRYRPRYTRSSAHSFIQSVCDKLSSPDRILPGGYLYMNDILSEPGTVERMGEILAEPFHKASPDFVLTVETRGIPVALMTARALGVPLIMARHESELTDGSVVAINYVSTERRRRTMTLARRSVKEGQRALIVDDFMKGGGTVRGLMDMMREFSITVVGVGVVMAMASPERKLVDQYRNLITMRDIDEAGRRVSILPASWLADK